MEKNVLKVRMLGTFSLEYKGKELVLDRNKCIEDYTAFSAAYVSYRRRRNFQSCYDRCPFMEELRWRIRTEA